jgi:hypothetical protein
LMFSFRGSGTHLGKLAWIPVEKHKLGLMRPPGGAHSPTGDAFLEFGVCGWEVGAKQSVGAR